MNRRFLTVICAISLAGQLMPSAYAASQPDLNFKIYSPETTAPATPIAPAPAAHAGSGLQAETPKTDDSANSAPAEQKPSDSLWSTDPAPSTDVAPAPSAQTSSTDTAPSVDVTPSPAVDAVLTPAPESEAAPAATDKQKVLKGYIRVVPSGTKIPIVMDTPVDSDTSQEGDEFAARTAEDLNIDGNTVVPAGSIIKGRIAQLNAPKNMGRSGSVALKFDTVTTPDNRQIPLVANLVARGGVVHARRGMKDIAMDTGSIMLPTALGLGIGVLAGSSNSSSSSGSHRVSRGSGALIGAGVGAAVGVAILLIKKGKKIDVRPGDELKIELAEDLRMPM